MNDIIAAIATADGPAGVGVIRLSGPGVERLAHGIFEPGSRKFAGFRPYVLHRGRLLDGQGRALDEALAVFMPGPGSYTGEDVVEFQCHGAPVIMRAVLARLLELGARLARPGEFTQRAYLSGRMDLTQAEAVAELVSAQGMQAVGLALDKLGGLMGDRVRGLRLKLEDLRAKLCLAVDFPEEDMQCLSLEEFASEAGEVKAGVSELVEGYSRARIWREGALAVLTGRVNAGKSSLLNALLGRERAIVADLPGTTRDYLEEALSFEGLPVRLIDTAGHRQACEPVELAGLAKCAELAEEADLLILVVDAGLEFDPLKDAELWKLAEAKGQDKVLVALNKCDLGVLEKNWEFFLRRGFEALKISARTGAGLPELCRAARDKLCAKRSEFAAGALSPNLRQRDALAKAGQELDGLLADIGLGLPYDILGVRLQCACACLAEVTGEISSHEVLNSIFANFCIGK